MPKKPPKEMTFTGLHMMAGLEGFVPAPYRDVAGVDTVYFGHTRGAGLPDPRQMSALMPDDWRDKLVVGFALLDDDLDTFEAKLHNVLPDLNPHEFDGWLMWYYNTGGLHQTSAVAKWKRGDKAGAIATLQRWNKVTKNGVKVVNQHLVQRRQQEAEVILHGRYHNPPVPVWGTDNNRRVVWDQIGSIGFDEARRMTRRGGGPEARRKNPTEPEAYGLGAAIAAVITAVGTTLAVFWDKVGGLLPW